MTLAHDVPSDSPQPTLPPQPSLPPDPGAVPDVVPVRDPVVPGEGDPVREPSSPQPPMVAARAAQHVPTTLCAV